MGNCLTCKKLYSECQCKGLGIDPLLVALGRAMAPQINARLAELDKELAERKRHPLDAE